MNKKTLFLIITLIAMLILVTSVNATNDNTNTSTTHSISEKTTTTEPVVKEVQKQEKSPEKQATTNKEINKKNKTKENTKKDPITINGVTYTQVIENQILNENKEIAFEESTYINNTTINNEEFPGLSFYGDGRGNVFDSYINNSNINAFLYTEAGTITITNTILNEGFYNWESTVIIDDTVTFGDNFYIYNEDNDFNFAGKICSNNTELIQMLSEIGVTVKPIPRNFHGNVEINNENITNEETIPSTGNITLTNCQINAKITNQGNLVRQAIVFSS